MRSDTFSPPQSIVVSDWLAYGLNPFPIILCNFNNFSDYSQGENLSDRDLDEVR